MKDRLRRSRLFLPGNNPKILQDGGVFEADSVILDLEDAVSIDSKDEARILVKWALRDVDFGKSEVLIRVNSPETEFFEADMGVISDRVDGIVLPKAESKEDVQNVASVLDKIEKEKRIGREIIIIPTIESALGIMNAYDIARAPRVAALAFGAEDFTKDIGAERTPEGKELWYARSAIVTAAKAAGVQALDTVYPNVHDDEGLRREIEMVRRMGFDGKSAIHPNQIGIIHDVFTPSGEEINKALAVMQAIKEAEEKKSGVIALNGRMIDRPVVERAKKVIRLAKAAGIDTEHLLEE